MALLAMLKGHTAQLVGSPDDDGGGGRRRTANGNTSMVTWNTSLVACPSLDQPPRHFGCFDARPSPVLCKPLQRAARVVVVYPIEGALDRIIERAVMVGSRASAPRA